MEKNQAGGRGGHGRGAGGRGPGYGANGGGYEGEAFHGGDLQSGSYDFDLGYGDYGHDNRVGVGPEGVFAQGDLTALGRDVVAWPAGPAVAGKLAAMVVGAGPASTVPINSTLEATHSWAQPKERRLGLNQVQAMARQRMANEIMDMAVNRTIKYCCDMVLAEDDNMVDVILDENVSYEEGDLFSVNANDVRKNTSGSGAEFEGDVTTGTDLVLQRTAVGVLEEELRGCYQRYRNLQMSLSWTKSGLQGRRSPFRPNRQRWCRSLTVGLGARHTNADVARLLARLHRDWERMQGSYTRHVQSVVMVLCWLKRLLRQQE
ncbi:hypothetical protein C2845_PM15G26800 [Panicum miliaceum]|uniref:Uncharacterized protein n=1 Tax=Panicum miliaceum TaxID=4540 RepID=A0A3L6Q7F3_PANMI|nr:hypothetical protein C2845_PM15G26800 [Panicum miliaceum]